MLHFGYFVLLLSSGHGASISVAWTDPTHGLFSVSLGGAPWLWSAEPASVFSDGAWNPVVVANGTVRNSTGVGSLGWFCAQTVPGMFGSSTKRLVELEIRSYRAGPGACDGDSNVASFVVRFVGGANATGYGTGGALIDPVDVGAAPLSRFPSFDLSAPALSSGGLVTWQDMHTRSVRANAVPLASLQMRAGPVVLFREAAAGDACTTPSGTVRNTTGLTAVVVSPTSLYQHAAPAALPLATDLANMHAPALALRAWVHGPSANVTWIPPGTEFETALVAGCGVGVTLAQWGRRLRAAAGTWRVNGTTTSVGLDYVSYWTDNGAYYFPPSYWSQGVPDSAIMPTTPLLADKVIAMRAAGIPPASLQLDTWWNPVVRSYVGAWLTTDWIANQTSLPGGLPRLAQATGVSALTLYSCMFACNSSVWHLSGVRPEQSLPPSGGHIESDLPFCVPNANASEAFYGWLLDQYSAPLAAGGQLEIDFLVYQAIKTPALAGSLGAPARWLAGASRASVTRQVAAQMCMVLPSQVLESLTLPAFTNARASDDFPCNGNEGPYQNWRIGGSSHLHLAAGLRPSKDSLWTVASQAGAPPSCGGSCMPCPYEQPNSALDLVEAVLATGPVGVADSAASLNATLLRMATRADGMLLQPSRPALAVDDDLASAAGRALPGNGSLWSTVTVLVDSTASGAPLPSIRWSTVVAIGVAAARPLRVPDELDSAGDDAILGNPAARVATLHGPVSLAAPAPAGAPFAPPSGPGWLPVDGLTVSPQVVAGQWFALDPFGALASCKDGSDPMASGCAQLVNASDSSTWPNLQSAAMSGVLRPFRLLSLAPVLVATSSSSSCQQQWSFLGELGAITMASVQRLRSVQVAADGSSLSVQVAGVPGESVILAALGTTGQCSVWRIVRRQANIDASGVATVVFTQ